MIEKSEHSSRVGSGRGALAALGVLAVASVSFAEEYSLPGNSCVAEGPFSALYFSDLAKNSNITNAISLLCPIIRRAPDTSAVSAVEVEVKGHLEGIECYVRSCGPDGSSCAASATDSSSSVGHDTLLLGNVDGDPDGWAYLKCELP